ncbi:AMP-binding enzyme [Hirsutella rhossiliensis]|uniref:AMP-binding enzyme domain-containing protein n=1 Tax=Hirsutella rhossiliensis TaxID=111463 RepID=A0A9P8SJD7_9HYPO|nr:AMP-binding enzyme domain-containing protein [Hirsutella rhossiliensis]KAH0965193.1 AMP-binding enzyme domain-containing protein [Hirsutella rhossiliensis]
MEFEAAPRKLWEHPHPEQTAMWRFMQESNRRYGLHLKNFHDLHKWSCERRSQFYAQLWDTQRWIHEGSFSCVVDESVPISKLPRWFAGVRLNWAENLLWTRGPDGAGARSTLHKEDGKTAVTEVREGGRDVVDVTWAELRARVARLAAAMQARGVGEGDRVVMVGAHACQTLVVFLATAWLGAVFSSSSTDMGVAGLLQRTVQIDPKFIFFDDAALYNGKVVYLHDKIKGVIDGMQGCSLFQKVVVVERFAHEPRDTSGIAQTERLEQFLQAAPVGSSPPPIRRIGFQDPLIIYYSSGTTGTPKAIVHGVGPLLMNVVKEGALHFDLTPDDVGLQYTTTGWIMYLASVAHLVMGGRAVLYDGSPFAPDPAVLLRVAQQQRVSILGVSPRWMTELMRRNIAPRDVVDLSRLKVVTSTGMVLPEQMFAWFYDRAFPGHVQLANMSGGTDIAGSFVLANPLLPVHVGGCVGGGLGVPMAIFDHDLDDGSDGVPLAPGTPGDLVSTGAFPNVPLFLWGDAEPAPGPKYHGSYFARFNEAWAQGDFCAVHPLTGAVLMLGRSDGVLNPSGIRFGSADIYAVVERCFAADVAESLCVGQRRAHDVDERVLLFLVMKPGKGEVLDRDTRHVPKYVFAVPEIPVTVNGKKVELPVKAIVSGKTVKPSGTLLNPGSLDFFYRFQKVEELSEPLAKL